jgi:hypothetical protein
MTRTDEAPDDAQRQQRGDRVAGRDVHALDLVAGCVGDGEQADQRPLA